MKRILFITTNDGVSWGGSEELWLSCLKEALSDNLEVGFCVQWNPLPPKLEAVRSLHNVKWFQKKIEQSFSARLLNKFLPQKLKTKRNVYGKELVDWKPDIVVISQGNNADGLDAMQFCETNKLNYWTISHAAYEGIWPDTAKAEKMRKGYRNAVANYFVSEANLQTTTLQISETVKNAKVVRNPYNVPYHNDALPYPSTDIFRLACVARFEFYAKGQDVLLEVMNDEKWRKRNVAVTFYGSGPNEDNIRRLISYFDLKNVFIGGHKLTTDIWKENHALVLPSRFEGLPLALVEAMLSGRFGIVSDVSGNREVFVDGVSGFLAEAPKADYFDKAMEQAWQNRHQWKEIGERAQAHVKKMIPEHPGKELLATLVNSYSNI